MAARPSTLPKKIIYILVRSRTSPKIVRRTFLLFVFTIPLDFIDLDALRGVASLTRLVGLLFFSTCLLFPKSCFRRPPQALWWFAGYVAIYLLNGLFLPKEYGDLFINGFQTLIQLLVFCWIGSTLLQEDKLMRHALLAFSIATLLAATAMLLGLPGFVEMREGRLSTIGANPNGLAALMALTAQALIGLGIYHTLGNIWMRVTCMAMSLVPITAMVYTGSRGSIMAFLTGAGVYALPYYGSKGKMAALLGVAIAVVSVVYVVVNDQNTLSRFEHSYYKDETAGRDKLFAAAKEMIAEKPLLGWQPIVFNYELGARTRRRVVDAHNLFFHLLMEGGLVGATPFLIGLGLCVRAAWTARTCSLGLLQLVWLITMIVLSMSGSWITMKLLWFVVAFNLASEAFTLKQHKRKNLFIRTILQYSQKKSASSSYFVTHEKVGRYIQAVSAKFNRLPRPARLSLMVSVLLVCTTSITVGHSSTGENKKTFAQNVVTPTLYCLGSCLTSPTPSPVQYSITPAISGVYPSIPAAPSVSPSGKAYYVAPNGLDSNAGSQSLPFQSITKGMGVLQAGDTLFVRGGTYTETLDDCLGTPFPSGTSWDNPVTIAGAPGEKVTIQPPSGSTFALDYQCGGGIQYVIFDNLIFDGSNLSNTVVKLAGKGSHHIRLQNSEIFGSPTQNGILGVSPYSELLNLNIHHNAAYGIYNTGHNTLMDHLDVHDNGGYGVHIYADGGNVNNNTLRNSRIYNNGFHMRNCWGGCIHPGMVLSSGTGNVAYNNLIYNNGNVGIQVGWSGENTSIYNNTIYGNGKGCMRIDNSTGATIRNNICFNNNGDIQGSTNSLTQDHNYTSDPQFVNAPADFHLKQGSPAIDAGMTLSQVATDIDGGKRPQGAGYDIGAYEYGAAPGGGNGGGSSPDGGGGNLGGGTQPPGNGGGMQGLFQQFLNFFKQMSGFILKLFGHGH